MCCFSGYVETVGDTSIFAGPDQHAAGKQVLVYEMSYAAAHELAMVLPLPILPGTGDDAVDFIDLSGYAGFFDDLANGFVPPAPDPDEGYLGGGDHEPPRPKLAVHDVGDFEASFVPTRGDFDRLEPRFRIAPEAWERLPGYADYGFAVFKLKAAAAGRRVHPMALSFPRRDPATLFFPTVHVHDGQVHGSAAFDHSLYLQHDGWSVGLVEVDEEPFVYEWNRSFGKVAGFLDFARLDDRLLDPAQDCFRLTLRGRFQNRDIAIGPGGSFPQPLPGRDERRRRAADLPPEAFAEFRRWQQAAHASGAPWMVVSRRNVFPCASEAEVGEALTTHPQARAYTSHESLEEQGIGLSRFHWEAGDRS